jgi:hypothetical protein
LVLAMAATGLLVVAAIVLNLGTGDIVESRQVWADQWRDYAAEECARSRWEECARLLDQARELDPEGEADERVRAMRRAMPDAGDSPPAPR